MLETLDLIIKGFSEGPIKVRDFRLFLAARKKIGSWTKPRASEEFGLQTLF